MIFAKRALLAAGIFSVACGCSSLEPGQSRYSGFLAATLTAVEAAPYDNVVKATSQAMKGLELKPMEREGDAFRTLFVGETVMGQLPQTHEVRVWVTRLSESTTQVEIRIVGRRDESRLRAIHDEIRKRLASAA
jgi:hypothetical protein